MSAHELEYLILKQTIETLRVEATEAREQQQHAYSAMLRERLLREEAQEHTACVHIYRFELLAPEQRA